MAEQRALFPEPNAPTITSPVPIAPTPAPAPREPTVDLSGVRKGDHVAIVGTEPLVVLTVERVYNGFVWTEPERVGAYSRRWNRRTGRMVNSGKGGDCIRPATPHEVAISEAHRALRDAEVLATNRANAAKTAASNVERYRRDLAEGEVYHALAVAESDVAAKALDAARARLAEVEAT